MINDNLYNPDIWRAYEDRYDLDEEYLGRNKIINKQTPLVSVCVATYNHEHLIRECLDSILLQETDFVFEILIGEDDSPDRTRNIVKEYATNHQDKIRLFLRDKTRSHYYDKNGKKVFNFNHKWLRKSARGKYIALCDGDDYWTDPKKLQKQATFLESNSDYSLCFHNAKVIWNSDGSSQNFSSIEEGEYTGIEIYDKWLVPTSSAMLRKKCIHNYRHAFNKDFIFGDIVLFITLAERGRTWYMDESMSVYRRHEGGVLHEFFSNPINIQKFANHQKQIIETFPRKYKKVGWKNLSWVYFLLFKSTFKTNIVKSLFFFIKSFYYSQKKSMQMMVNMVSIRLKD